jgi:hypothetical protein
MLGLAEMAWKLACKRTHQVSTYQGFPEVSREDCDDLTTIHNEYYRIIDFIETCRYNANVVITP